MSKYGLKFGRVKFFNHQEGKNYGFILVDGEKDVHFYFDNGRVIVAGLETPVFSRVKQCRVPSKGEHVVFTLEETGDKRKAIPWGFAMEFVRAERVIKCRPKTIFRVMKQEKVNGRLHGEVRVICEDINLVELCQKYPKKRKASEDTLSTHHSDESYSMIWFEQQTEKGWFRCEDPRILEEKVTSW